MNNDAIVQLALEAVVKSLTQGTPDVQIDYGTDMDGRPTQTMYPVLRESILQSLIREGLHTSETKERLISLILDLVTENPDAFVPALNELFTKYLDKERGSYYSEKTEFEKTVKAALEIATNNAAEIVLTNDESFRARVLDMAHLSDSDHIHVNIELKPKGQ